MVVQTVSHRNDGVKMNRMIVICYLLTLGYNASAQATTPVKISATAPGIKNGPINWDKPWWPWDGPNLVCCKYDSNVQVTVQGVTQPCYCSDGSDNRGFEVPKRMPTGTPFVLTNPTESERTVELKFYESGRAGTWQSYGDSTLKVPAGSSFSALVETQVQTTLHGQERQIMELARPEEPGGVLTFIPDKTDGTQGEIAGQGNNVVPYRIDGAEWKDSRWVAKNTAPMMLILNPGQQKLKPGTYSGTLNVKLDIP